MTKADYEKIIKTLYGNDKPGLTTLVEILMQERNARETERKEARAFRISIAMLVIGLVVERLWSHFVK